MLTAPAVTIALTFFCLLAVGQQADTAYRLIAHRGGVVDELHIEHSLSGLQAAIERGYWMVEIDVRATKDGLPVMHHDRDFRRYYKHPQNVADMTWEEIKHLRSIPGDHRPLLLSEFAAACRGKMNVMIEMKGPSHGVQYYKSVELILRENNLLDKAYMIGISEAKDYFRGKVRTSVQREGLEKATVVGEDVANLYFLFTGARYLDKETVSLARKSGIPIVAAINRHHYQDSNAMQDAQTDILRMEELGVRMFQIDSIYDRWLLK